jgi:hypothetical protein
MKRTQGNLAYAAKFGSEGNGNDQFHYPEDICSDGIHLYIADSWNHRIKKHLISDNSYVAKIGSLGTGDDEFHYPKGICYYDNHLFVIDRSNNRLVKRLASDLSYVAEIGTYGQGDDQFHYPECVCSSPDGYLYITDSENDRIVKRKANDLSYVSEIGTNGIGEDQFDFPHGIDYSDSYLYIGDDLNHRFIKRKASDLSYVSARSSSTQGIGADGVAWKTIYSEKIAKTRYFQGFRLTKYGTWAGTAKYRILCGNTKIYPAGCEGNIEDGVYHEMYHRLFCTKNSTFKIQFRSTNANDQSPSQAMILDKLSVADYGEEM